MAVHQALLLRQWSADVTLFSHTMPPPDGEEAERLAARGITVVDGQVASLEIVEDRLVGVRLSDGTPVRREVMAVAARMVARAGFLAALGLRPVEHPRGSASTFPLTRPAVRTCPAFGPRAMSAIWSPR